VTPQRWQEIEAVFEQAREVPAEQREAFFAQHCNGDEELRREVESLLASDARAGDFMEKRSLFFDAELSEEIEKTVAAGQMIGPYRVVRELGRGGMGAVYLAERADEQYHKQVAIKLIKRGMDTDSVLRQFRNERQILASFDNPNIARLFDGGTTQDGSPYFVMEYVEGHPIDFYCAEKKLVVRERLKLFRDACAAVSYAHRRAVIHRDIKPSNILVTADGVPKLLDFGIAKILQPGAAEGAVTVTAFRPMTPAYASPEQVRGEPVTTASDVYSLGVVLYQLLTGQLPYSFTSKSPFEIARAITETEPKKPSTITAERSHKSKRDLTDASRKSLKGDLDNILLLALRKDPARRYPSVEQFSEDIRHHLECRPVLARRDALRYRAAKFIQRNKVATAAAVLILLSLIAGLLATTWQTRRAEAQKNRAERRFKEVRQLAHSLLFDYHDAIKDLPGATRVREKLVKDALTYLDILAGEAVGDPGLQRELAAAYERLGDVRGRSFAASLGDKIGAIESYSRALKIREALAAASPKEVQNRRDLAASYLRIAAPLIETNESARGTDYLRKALTLCLKLRAEQPENSEIRYDLAVAYDELGHMLEDWWGDASGALENHRKALSLREEFVAADPGNQTHRRNLSVTYVNIGRALVQKAQTKEALESNLKALRIREVLVAESPSNVDFRRLLAISYQQDGNYRILLNDSEGALQSFRKKLALEEQSLTNDPANSQCQEDLGYSCERIGDLLAGSGDYAQALSSYERALVMYEGVAAVDPQLLRVRYRVAFARAGIASAEAKLGKREVALTECSRAESLLKDLPADPNINWENGFRADVTMNLAEVHAVVGSRATVKSEQQQQWQTARTMYSKTLDIWQQMRERGILAADQANKAQEVRDEIAKCDAVLGAQ
jgi:serine/threonine protein kinase